MTDWFRSWHGAPTDPKWLGIARRAGVAPGVAVAVGWALMDRASQAEERGSIEGYDADGLACFFGCEPEQVDAIVAAMTDKGMIAGGRFSAWEKRQPKREDNAAERARGWRERKRTQENAAEPPEVDTEKNSSLRSETRAGAPPPDDAKQALEIFNRIAADAGWPTARTLDSRRRSAMKARLGECGGIEGWVDALRRAKDSPFLTGENDRGWKADLDFLLQARSFTKLLEGGYDRRKSDRGPMQPRASPPLRGTNAMLESLARYRKDDDDDHGSSETLDLLAAKH